MRLELPNAEDIEAPTEEQVVAAIDRLDEDEKNPFVILAKGAEGDAFIQALGGPYAFLVEYRDGVTRRHYRSPKGLPKTTVRDLFAAYLCGDESYRRAVAWKDVTQRLRAEARARLVTLIIALLLLGVLLLGAGTSIYQFVVSWP